jgi:hypothetical protein
MEPSDLVQVPAILASPESRRLTLDYPSWIRIGDSGVIRLTLEAASLANVTPISGAGGNFTVDPTLSSASPHENYNVIAEARLDLEGTEVRPSETVSEPLVPGESVAFRWSVRTTQTGTYRGTAWLFLVFVDRSSGAQTRSAVSAQPVKIQATSLLGLGGRAARVLGGLGAVVAGVLAIPFIPAAVKRYRSRPRTNA